MPTTAKACGQYLNSMLAVRDARTIRNPHNIANWFDGHEQGATLRGLIETDPAGQSSFRVRLSAAKRQDHWETAEGKVYVWMRDGSSAARMGLGYGDIIEFSAWLRPPSGPRNPGGFELQRWLARQRVYVTAAIRQDDFCRILERGQGNPLKLLSLRLRERFQTAIHAGLEE